VIRYPLRELFFGTGNVVYNDAFYYQWAGHNEIIKYDIQRNETVAKVEIYQAAYQVCSHKKIAVGLKQLTIMGQQKYELNLLILRH
jgi:Olfactomedin-like domain